MRRFASVFTARREKPDTSSTVSSNDSSHPQAPKKSRRFASLARRATQPSLPPLIPANPTNSSSSSSSGSTTLRTPDDDALPHRPSKKGSWKSWLGAKKHDDLTGDDRHRQRLAPCSPPNSTLPRPRIDSYNVEIDETGSFPSEEGSEHSVSMIYSSSKIARARSNARIMIANSLIQQPTSPPLLEAAEFAPFPHSCSALGRLPRRDTLESMLHKKALLSRLDRLSPLEESSIVEWWSKTVATAQNTTRDPWHDFFPNASTIMRCSKGLRSWISRPYFEERVHVWTREDSGNVVCSRVAGPQFGVESLEYSEILHLLGGAEAEELEGTTFDPISKLLPPSQGIDPPTITLQLPETIPLDMETPLTTVTLVSSLEPNSEPPCPPTKAPVIGVSAPKRGVRFAEDDSKDDQIPLGYVVRKRKNKEQKAKFLRQERERKAMNQRELTIQEKEHARKEAERLEMEELRRAREMERKRVEDQEKQRKYMEEVLAARTRREASRAGQAPSSSAFFIHPSEGDRSGARYGGSASARRNSSSRGSELIAPTMSMSYDGSPASSLPATPGSQISFSRPPSVYSAHTASSEDVRSREARRISRRSSMASDPSKVPLQVPYNPRASFMPFGSPWGSIPPVPPVPSIPSFPVMPAVPFVNAMPLYGVEMPLLPPAAPFMMDQYRSRSARSYNSSQSQESLRHYSNQMPRNHSSDRVTSKSGSSTTGPHHRRRSSDGPPVASTNGKVPPDRSVHRQYDLRSSPIHFGSSQRHPEFVTTSLNSPRRTSVVQPPPSPSHRRARAS